MAVRSVNAIETDELMELVAASLKGFFLVKLLYHD